MPTPEETQAVLKEAFKEALSEWLDQKYTLVGKWTVRGITAMVLGLLTWAALQLTGWKPFV